LASSAFARHYLRNHYCFLFLRLLRCFSSAGLRLRHVFNVTGYPIRTSADQVDVCSYPQLFAAYHVLRRLREPRHPPYALSCFHLSTSAFTSPLLLLDTLIGHHSRGIPTLKLPLLPTTSIYCCFNCSTSLVNELFRSINTPILHQVYHFSRLFTGDSNPTACFQTAPPDQSGVNQY
jgi:hypothetical protein